MRLSDEEDPESLSFLEREFRFDRNTMVRSEAREEQQRAGRLQLKRMVPRMQESVNCCT